MIPKNKIEQEAIDTRQFDEGLFPNWTDANIWDEAFKQGVEFAEKELETMYLKIVDSYFHQFASNHRQDMKIYMIKCIERRRKL